MTVCRKTKFEIKAHKITVSLKSIINSRKKME